MFKDNSVILFQGDSITCGGRSFNDDPNHAMGHGYAYLVCTRLGADYPKKNFTFYNRGVSGNRIADLYGRWKEDAINLKPDVLSVLVGVNDVGKSIRDNSGSAPSRFEKIYKLLIEETQRECPSVMIVLCEPFFIPHPCRAPNEKKWEQGVRKLAATTRKVAEEEHAIFVPLQEIFSRACQNQEGGYWLWDGVHPMPAGHELIARQWLNTIRDNISKSDD